MITMSCLGRKGRWGNQIFQYAFLRTYALRYQLRYQCQDWIGRILLGHDDPYIGAHLPQMKEYLGEDNELAVPFPPLGSVAAGHDYNGYCQYHTTYYAPDKEFIQKLFVPITSLRVRLQPAVDNLRSRGETLIGFHMRRGDTGRLIYYLTPNAWYLRWLDKYWHTFQNPVLFIASERSEDRKAFEDAGYKPVMSSDLLPLSSEPYAVYNYLKYDLNNPTPISMDWFPDWYLLTQCDVLVFGNSTFSFSAAMVSTNLKEAWRSRLSMQSFELIDPWHSMPLVREDLRNYPGVADTWYDRNPQWEGGECLRR